MLYFDQPHLTLTGRQRALEVARDVLPKIFVPGDRVTVLVNGTSLLTVQPLTSDLDAVLDVLAHLKLDAGQVDGNLLAGETNADALQRLVMTKGFTRGKSTQSGQPDLSTANNLRFGQQLEISSMAGSMGRDVAWVTMRDWTRLQMALRRLADVDTSRAMIYFADSISRRAGSRVEFEFERLVREGAAFRIRVYTVEPILLRGGNRSVALGLHASEESQKTLQSLASQTGARAFINGVTADEMANGIREDQGCRWLLSFDAERLPQDKPMEVFVRVAVPGVRVHAPAKFEIQSPAKRAATRLMAQFALDEGAPTPLRSGLVPLAWKDGKYTALLQVTAPGMDLPSVTWDLGASVAERGQVGARASGRTRVAGTGIPVTLETTVELAPGAFELAAVAREVTTDRVISVHGQADWPEPDDVMAQVIPPVVLQPGTGAFSRDGEARRSGSLVLGRDDPVDPRTAHGPRVARLPAQDRRGRARRDPRAGGRLFRGVPASDAGPEGRALRPGPGHDPGQDAGTGALQVPDRGAGEGHRPRHRRNQLRGAGGLSRAGNRARL
jgi:hypothetical protein